MPSAPGDPCHAIALKHQRDPCHRTSRSLPTLCSMTSEASAVAWEDSEQERRQWAASV